MEYKILDAFNINDRTVLTLDKRRIVQDLGCRSSMIDGTPYKIFSVHPDEFVVIAKSSDPEKLKGKTISLYR